MHGTDRTERSDLHNPETGGTSYQAVTEYIDGRKPLTQEEAEAQVAEYLLTRDPDAERQVLAVATFTLYTNGDTGFTSTMFHPGTGEALLTDEYELVGEDAYQVGVAVADINNAIVRFAQEG